MPVKAANGDDCGVAAAAGKDGDRRPQSCDVRRRSFSLSLSNLFT